MQLVSVQKEGKFIIDNSSEKNKSDSDIMNGNGLLKKYENLEEKKIDLANLGKVNINEMKQN